MEDLGKDEVESIIDIINDRPSPNDPLSSVESSEAMN